jgi:hypothetical protein
VQDIPSEEEARLEGERAESAGSYKNTLAERDAALAEAYRTRGPGSGPWKATQEKLDAADEKCRRIFAKLHRLGDAVKLPAFAIWGAAILLAILEAPINKFMLDNILRSTNIDSYIFSAFVTFTILLLAHIAGKQTRQIWSAYEERLHFSNIAVTVVLVGIMFLCVAALTIGRSAYTVSGAVLPGGQIFAEITRQIRGAGFWGALIKALSDQNAFFLACMNAAAIAAAFFVSFITHDSDRTYQSALDEKSAAEKKLEGIEVNYGRTIEKIGRKYRPTLTNLAAAYEAQNARIIGLKRARNCALSAEDRVNLSDSDKFLEASRLEIRLKAVKPRHEEDENVKQFPEAAHRKAQV